MQQKMTFALKAVAWSLVAAVLMTSVEMEANSVLLGLGVYSLLTGAAIVSLPQTCVIRPAQAPFEPSVPAVSPRLQFAVAACGVRPCRGEKTAFAGLASASRLSCAATPQVSLLAHDIALPVRGASA
jgi:hypothetical protein